MNFDVLTKEGKQTLIKLLNRTSSNFDSEALACIRKANVMLKESNVVWEQLILDHKIDLGDDHAYAQTNVGVESYQGEINEMFDLLLKVLSPLEPITKFVSGIEKFYRSRNYLTPKQLTGLRNVYMRNQRR